MKSEPQVCHCCDAPDHTEPERSSGMIFNRFGFSVYLCLVGLKNVLSLFPPPTLPPSHLQVVYSCQKHTSSETWLTAGGRRETGEIRTDTDTHTAVGHLQTVSCSSAAAVFSSTRTPVQSERGGGGDSCSCQGTRLGRGNAKALLGLDQAPGACSREEWLMSQLDLLLTLSSVTVISS